MSSNVRPAVRATGSLPRFTQSSKPGQMHRRPTRDGRPLAQNWDEENCDLSCCRAGSAKSCVRTIEISQEHPEAFHLRRKSNPIAPFEMASGLLQVSSVEKAPSGVRFHWDGAACHSIYRFSSNRHFCSCKAQINL